MAKKPKLPTFKTPMTDPHKPFPTTVEPMNKEPAGWGFGPGMSGRGAQQPDYSKTVPGNTPAKGNGGKKGPSRRKKKSGSGTSDGAGSLRPNKPTGPTPQLPGNPYQQ